MMNQTKWELLPFPFMQIADVHAPVQQTDVLDVLARVIEDTTGLAAGGPRGVARGGARRLTASGARCCASMPSNDNCPCSAPRLSEECRARSRTSLPSASHAEPWHHEGPSSWGKEGRSSVRRTIDRSVWLTPPRRPVRVAPNVSEERHCCAEQRQLPLFGDTA
jgi:hypothetical protein